MFQKRQYYAHYAAMILILVNISRLEPRFVGLFRYADVTG